MLTLGLTFSMEHSTPEESSSRREISSCDSILYSQRQPGRLAIADAD